MNKYTKYDKFDIRCNIWKLFFHYFQTIKDTLNYFEPIQILITKNELGLVGYAVYSTSPPQKEYNIIRIIWGKMKYVLFVEYGTTEKTINTVNAFLLGEIL